MLIDQLPPDSQAATRSQTAGAACAVALAPISTPPAIPTEATAPTARLMMVDRTVMTELLSWTDDRVAVSWIADLQRFPGPGGSRTGINVGSRNRLCNHGAVTVNPLSGH